MNLYEIIGKKEAELRVVQEEYTKLLTCLHEVNSGNILPEDITVDLQTGSWKIAAKS